MKTVAIYLEVNDMDDAIRILNDINQLPVGKLKNFHVYGEYGKYELVSNITGCNRILKDKEYELVSNITGGCNRILEDKECRQ